MGDDVKHIPLTVSSKVGESRRRVRHTARPRSRTIGRKDLTQRSVREFNRHEFEAELAIQRPRTRGECVDAGRPCPWVGCRYHLFLDVNPETGTIKMNRPEIEPWQMAESCALDLADRGAQTLDVVGDAMNVTRERTRQLELIGLHALRAVAPELG